MINRVRSIAFLPIGLLAFGLLVADVGRPREIEKVDKPGGEKGNAGAGKEEKEQPGPGKRLNLEEHEKLHQKLASEGEANLKEIARLMEKVQNNLKVRFHNHGGDIEFTPSALRVTGKLRLEEPIFLEDFAWEGLGWL